MTRRLLPVLILLASALPAQLHPRLRGPLAELANAISDADLAIVGTDGKPLELTSGGNQFARIEGLRRRTGWVKNMTKAPVRLRELVLADLAHQLEPDTAVYGEGFQMLSQTEGTLAQPTDLEPYTDRGHYKLPETAGMRRVYGMTLLSLDGGHLLIGFLSCNHFVGHVDFDKDRIRVVLDTEDIELAPGKSIVLEPLYMDVDTDRNALLARFADELQKANKVKLPAEPPAGWCSWYCFGPKVTATDVERNLDLLAQELPALKYVQIDDGYQPHMGDWLETGAAFGGDIKAVLATIKAKGFVPAIWVAPFIADGDSSLFHDHPDWFVQDRDGKPLRSDKVGFGGWRLAPWYCLDGTHPAVQQHLQQLFRTLREDWGCGYFKLDANYWGAIQGGVFHDKHATRVDAYRRGMQAIRRGAGDAFVLGCNHPLWPSIGLIDGSRSSMDVDRSFATMARTGRENLLRSWQNGKLWWNDPDCLLVAEPLSDQEVSFHASLLLATGGMLLSGDDLPRMTERRRDLLRRALAQRGVAARFDAALRHGILARPDGTILHVFLRWDDTAWDGAIELSATASVTDFWTGEDLGEHQGRFAVDLPPRAGRVLVVRPRE